MAVSLRLISATLFFLAALAPLAQARSDMEIDGSFGGGIVDAGGYPSVVYSDGRVLTARFEQKEMVLTRFRPDGRRDRRFGSLGNGTAVIPPIPTDLHQPQIWWPSALAVWPGGHILLAGTYVAAELKEPESPTHRPLEFLPSGRSVTVIAKLSPQGRLEWLRSGSELPRAIGRGARIGAIAFHDRRIVLGGTAAQGAFLARVNANGTVNAAFARQGGLAFGEKSGDAYETAAGVTSLLVDDRDRIHAAGYSGGRAMIARFTSDGDRDPRFGGDGIVYPTPARRGCPCSSSAQGLARDRQGRLLVSGNFYANRSGAFLQRYRPDGSLDGSFGHRGTVLARVNGETVGGGLTLGRSGTIYVAGSSSDPSSRRMGVSMTVFRFLADGRPDRNFFGDGVLDRYVGNRIGNLVTEPQVPTLDDAGRLTVVTAPLVMRLRPRR
jgi:uncharacterized delta-60 repeat protein